MNEDQRESDQEEQGGEQERSAEQGEKHNECKGSVWLPKKTNGGSFLGISYDRQSGGPVRFFKKRRVVKKRNSGELEDRRVYANAGGVSQLAESDFRVFIAVGVRSP